MNTICKHLRTKKMYTGTPAHEAFVEKEGEHVTPSHFWCNCTQREIGGDGNLAHPNQCNSSRRCFEE
ncbi:MAG TPA: hypothetical protein VFV23_11050 [Verrucomicrobiae bacterium]|nr:hypothetical protein [Verrucomicrobiae bacterium]